MVTFLSTPMSKTQKKSLPMKDMKARLNYYYVTAKLNCFIRCSRLIQLVLLHFAWAFWATLVTLLKYQNIEIFQCLNYLSFI